MATLRLRLSVLVLGAVGVLLLVTAGVRATLQSRRPCRGTIEAESLWQGSEADAQKSERATARAKTLISRHTAVIVRDERISSWEGGTYERDWRMGDLVAYEHGTYYRSSYPWDVTVGLADACDDRTVLHDGYHTGTLEARHDPETGLWYAITMSGDTPSFATPIRIVEKPGTRFTPKASFFLALVGLLVFLAALLSLRRAFRFGRLRRLDEAIVVGAFGCAKTSDGEELTLEPPPPVGSVVLVEARGTITQTAPYREGAERTTTARWLPFNRARARRSEIIAFAFASMLYVVALAFGIGAFGRL